MLICIYYVNLTAKAKAEARKVGNPWTDVEQGPLVDKDQFNKVLEMIFSGKDQGATLQCGGHRAMDKGYFVKPTVFSGNITFFKYLLIV